MKKKLRPGVDEASLLPHIAEIRAHIDENRLLESLVEELAVQKLAMQELRHSLIAMKTLLRARDLVLPDVTPRYSSLHEVSIDAGMPLAAEMGFHVMQVDEHGRPFRWTGPGASFFFDLHLDRTTPLGFTLYLAPINRGAGQLRCRCEGRDTPLVARGSRETIQCSGALPPRKDVGATRLEFFVDRMFKPDTENRMLGVPFQRLHVVPVGETEIQKHAQAGGAV